MESKIAFPFRKLRNDKYLMLDVLMYVLYQVPLNFMYALNKESRLFIALNLTTIKNGFINDGLIDDGCSFVISENNHF